MAAALHRRVQASEVQNLQETNPKHRGTLLTALRRPGGQERAGLLKPREDLGPQSLLGAPAAGDTVALALTHTPGSSSGWWQHWREGGTWSYDGRSGVGKAGAVTIGGPAGTSTENVPT